MIFQVSVQSSIQHRPFRVCLITTVTYKQQFTFLLAFITFLWFISFTLSKRFTQIRNSSLVSQMQSHDPRKHEYAVKKAATCFFCIAPVSLGAYFFRVGVQYSTNVENFKLTRKSGHSTTATQMMTSVFFFFVAACHFYVSTFFLKRQNIEK